MAAGNEPLRYVDPGEPIQFSARTWNLFVDAARYVRDRRAGKTGGLEPAFELTGTLEVYVRNDTGGDLAVRSVVKIGDPVASAVNYPQQVQQQPLFEATAPAANTDAFGVTLEAIPDGKVGRAAVAGVAVVDVDVNADSHGYAEPAASQTTMLETVATGPARILWRESGTSGTKRAAVLLSGGSQEAAALVRGKLDGALSYQGSATMSIWYWNGSAEADTTENVTVYDWLLSSGQTIASGTQVTAAWDARSGRYYVTGAQCP